MKAVVFELEIERKRECISKVGMGYQYLCR